MQGFIGGPTDVGFVFDAERIAAEVLEAFKGSEVARPDGRLRELVTLYIYLPNPSAGERNAAFGFHASGVGVGIDSPSDLPVAEFVAWLCGVCPIPSDGQFFLVGFAEEPISLTPETTKQDLMSTL